MKRSIRTAILPLALAVSTPAVAGPYEDFFQASGESAEDGIRSKSPPQVFASNDLDTDIRRFLEDGYFIIGASSWVGTPEDPKKTAKFAKKIKASVALVRYRYIDTVSGGTQVVMMPIIGGYGGMIGGAQPVSFARYEQTAYFFIKSKPENIGLGLWFQNLTPMQVNVLGSGKGISVTAVVRGSPAFDAGVIAGDIILTFAGQDISTRERWDKTRADSAGQTVPVEIIRDGQPQTLQITMPAVAPVQAKR
jgi:membrane-associated protease RseP (regulator of RpoE activity)